MEKKTGNVIKLGEYELVVKDDSLAHLQAPIYKEAREFWADVQAGQIQKGFEKYGTVLNPDALSVEQLYRHGMEEQIDGVHYLTALKQKAETLENTVKEQYAVIAELIKQSEEDNRRIETATAEIEKNVAASRNLIGKMAKLCKALAFYADIENYEGIGETSYNRIELDSGKLAREVLGQ